MAVQIARAQRWKPRSAQLGITAMVESGKVRPVLDPRRFTLDTAMAEHNAVEQGANVKVVIDIINA
ncbi:MAG TPA: hypothetical protein VES70_29945 [Pseudomonas sp.]|nr:hypothetical protein [Pseudomonas sp.]